MRPTLRTAEALAHLKKSLYSEATEQEAHWMLMDILNCSFADIVLRADRELTPAQIQKMKTYLSERNTGKPLAYVLGHQDFYKYRFLVNEHTLIPRPETELIVELAQARGPFASIADLGTGSGCIGLSLLKEFSSARLWACDISPGAVEIFKKNAEQLGVAARTRVVTGDATAFHFENEFDLVVSNPPYIAESDSRVEKDVLNFEPATALFAPEEGLAYYKLWSQWAWRALQKGSVAVFEFGSGQHTDVAEFFKQAGFKQITIHKDLFGVERVVCAVKD